MRSKLLCVVLAIGFVTTRPTCAAGGDKKTVHEGGDPPKASQDKNSGERARIQGAWVLADAEINGMKLPAETSARTTLAVTGDRWEVDPPAPGPDGKPEIVFKLAPKAMPKAIDLIRRNGPDKGKAFKGIYRLEKDVLTVCIAFTYEAPRPAEFTAPAGADRVLLVWKRTRTVQVAEGADPSPGWVKVESRQHSSSVSFPGKPKVKSSQGKTTWELVEDGLTFHFFFEPWKAPIPEERFPAMKVLLAEGPVTMATVLEGALLSNKEIRVQSGPQVKHLGRESVIASAKLNGRAWMRSFVTSRGQYIIQVSGPAKDVEGGKAKRFMDSFRFLAGGEGQ